MSRVAVVVIDACGAGALPDAAEYGDAGTNTLAHVAAAVGGLDLPTLGALGLGSILPLAGVSPSSTPVLHGRLAAHGYGKDSTAGHWELMGVVADSPAQTYPSGVPSIVVRELEAATGRRYIGGHPTDGISVLEKLGDLHLRTGALILYTSQDSVLQIAAHVDRVTPDELYAVCAAAREVVDVGRVIARPFEGMPGAFRRTEGRRDFALAPPCPSYLDALRHAHVPVHAVGKVNDLFVGRGIDRAHPGATNAAALASTTRLLRELESGLIFTNLVETDQVYGHRKDVKGFHRALREIDAEVGRWLHMLRHDDLLILTSDHGCDPSTAHSDHTREHAPLLAVAQPDRPGGRHDGTLADVGATAHLWLTRADAIGMPGRPFVQRA